MPGRRYALAATDTNTAATTQWGLVGTAAVRPQIFDILISSVATPADNAGEYLLQRITTTGTSTSVTPAPLDSGDPAATCPAGQNHSAEPTYTSNTVLLRIATNQRATFRHVTAPEAEFKGPATASNGFGFLANAIGGSAVAMAYTALFAE